MRLFQKLFFKNKKLEQKKPEFDRTLRPIVTCEYHSNVAQIYYMMDVITSNNTVVKKEQLLCHNVLDDNQFSFLDTETKGEKVRLHSNVNKLSKDDSDYINRYLELISLYKASDPTFYLYKASNVSIDPEVLNVVLFIISCKNCFAYISEKDELFFGGSYTDMLALNCKLRNSYKYSDSLFELIQHKLAITLPDFFDGNLSSEYYEGLSDFSLRESYLIKDCSEAYSPYSHMIIAYDSYPSQYHMNRQFVIVVDGVYQNTVMFREIPIENIINISTELDEDFDESSIDILEKLKQIFECNNLPTEELSGNESLYDLIDEIIPEE